MTRTTITLAALFLSSCGPKPLEFVRPPADKLECLEEPGRPGVPGAPVTDAEAGAYMADLRKAGQSCRDDVNWMRDWFKNLPD